MSTARYRNLLIIIGVLLLTNIGVLVYFLRGKHDEGVKSAKVTDEQPSTVTGMLQKEVGFNDEQLGVYKQMKEKQKEIIRPMFDDMRQSKDSLFRLLSYPETSDSVLERLADVIARKQKALDLQTFTYFRKVRTLCQPDQLPRYDSMILPMLRRMGKNFKHNEPAKPVQKK
jgi:protein CpxP